jgi:hypothetical protein
LITTWDQGQTGRKTFAARLDLARPEAGFRTIKQITESSGLSHHATLLDTGEVLIVYEAPELQGNIVMKQGTFDTLPDAQVRPVTDTAADERFPFAFTVGRRVLILWHENPSNTWRFKWYDPHNADHPFSEAHILADGSQGDDLHAAVDLTNRVWVAFHNRLSTSPSNSEIKVINVPPDPDELPGQPQLLRLPNSLDNYSPFVMVDKRDNVWVFWSGTTGGIWYRRFLRPRGEWETVETQIPGTSGEVSSLTAVSDAEGGIWLFWLSTGNIWYVRYNPVTQIWGEPRQLTRHLGTDSSALFVLRGPDGSFWLFWRRSVVDLTHRLLYRRIFLSI